MTPDTLPAATARWLAPSPANTAALLGLDLNGIMWCDATVNPGLAGCAYVSPACGTADRSSQCYAEATAAGIVRKGRSDKAPPGMHATAEFYAQGLTPEGRWTGRIHVDGTRIEHAFAKFPKKAGRIRRVFVTSMSDLFHTDVPEPFLCKVFHEMAARPHIDFLVLTKRADRMAEFGRIYTKGWPANVWAGCTVEDQRRADERIPYLLSVPAAVRFLSVEPMLGPIKVRHVCGTCKGTGYHGVAFDNLPQSCTCYADPGWRSALTSYMAPYASWQTVQPNGMWRCWHGIDWVIVGSESNGNAPGARKTDPAWVLDLVKRCDDASVPVFVKQLEIDGRLCTLPEVNGRMRAEFPGTRAPV
jgi:protein gp37